MSENNYSSANAAAMGLAAGSLIGLIVGMLYAPKSGEENRRDLINNYNAAKSRMRYRAGRAKENVKGKIGNRRGNSDDINNEDNAKLLAEAHELEDSQES